MTNKLDKREMREMRRVASCLCGEELTQLTAAQKMGISRRLYQRFEAGSKGPVSKNLLRGFWITVLRAAEDAPQDTELFFAEVDNLVEEWHKRLKNKEG